MSKYNNPIEDYVFSLSPKDFKDLISAINKRIDKDKYGFVSFEEAAISYQRIPSCPKCGSTSYHLDGKTNAGNKRYRCNDCNASYTLLTSSIFNSAKIPLHKLISYIQLMSYNVPLELLCEALNIANNTAELWRKKIFSTVNDYQDHLMLNGTVWIDETFVEDNEIEAVNNGKHLRGL